MMMLRAFAVVLCVTRITNGRRNAGTVPGPGSAARCGGGGGVKYNFDGVKDLDGVGALMALRWGGGPITTTTVATAVTVVEATATSTTRNRGGDGPVGLRFLDGFFYRKHNATGSRVTNRVRDVDRLADGTALAADQTTEQVALDPARDVFATEPECESANDHRPCVCFVPDFLDDLLDEARTGAGSGNDGDGTDDRWTAAECASYKVVPRAFIVSPTAKGAVEVQVAARGSTTTETLTENTAAAVWIPVDFDRVVGYRPEKSNDRHIEVHYGLTGCDVKVKCLVDGGDGENVKSDAFKWDYEKNKHSTNSTVTITSTGTLLISTLDRTDSKNYTCLVRGEKRDITYVHDVLAVERPLYEIRGRAFYKNIHGGCTNDIVTPFRDQLPGLVRDVLCQQDEQSRSYACNVVIETLECSEDKVSLEIDYRVTLNDDANFLTLVRATKNGRNAVYNQKMFARASAVLAANLKKLLTVQIISKYSTIESLFEPDISATRLEQFVACTPGFGIREIFCTACQVHQYSPDRSAECVKCSPGFHQPITGSDKCVKCPNVFASGCEVLKTIRTSIYLTIIGLFLLICLVLVASCVYCCRSRDPNTKSGITKIPCKIINSSFGKLKNKYDKLSTSSVGDGKSSSGGSVLQSYEKMKNRLSEQIKKGYKNLSSSRVPNSSGENIGGSIRRKIKKFNNMSKEFGANKLEKLFRKKSSHKIVTPKLPFDKMHDKISRHYEENRKPTEQTTHQQPDDSV